MNGRGASLAAAAKKDRQITHSAVSTLTTAYSIASYWFVLVVAQKINSDRVVSSKR